MAQVSTAATARRSRSSAGYVIGSIVMGLIGLMIVLGVLVIFGAGGAVSLLAAAVPAPLLVALVLRVDRYEPEPNRVLFITFLYGATAAAVFAAIVGGLGQVYVSAAFGADTGEFLSVSLVAPVVEETLKSLAVLVVFWRLRDEFNGVVDAVVYSAMVGLGFAVTENVLYYAEALIEGPETFVGTVFLRGVLSPFAHPLFTSMFGIGLAMAIETTRARALWPVLGWFGAMFLHGLWNASASVGAGFLGVYVLVFVPLFLAVCAAAILASRREGRLVRKYLAEDVTHGVLTQNDFEELGSIRRRRAAERRAARLGGTAARDQSRDFHAAATRLAFLRHRRHSGGLHAATAEEEARQLEEVARAKAAAEDVLSRR